MRQPVCGLMRGGWYVATRGRVWDSYVGCGLLLELSLRPDHVRDARPMATWHHHSASVPPSRKVRTCAWSEARGCACEYMHVLCIGRLGDSLARRLVDPLDPDQGFDLRREAVTQQVELAVRWHERDRAVVLEALPTPDRLFAPRQLGERLACGARMRAQRRRSVVLSGVA